MREYTNVGLTLLAEDDASLNNVVLVVQKRLKPSDAAVTDSITYGPADRQPICIVPRLVSAFFIAPCISKRMASSIFRLFSEGTFPASM